MAVNTLAKVEPSTYAIATYDEAQLREVVEINLGGGDALTERDLRKFAVPSGGGVAFNVETADGKADVAKEILGVVVLHQPRRAYWEKGVEDGSGSTPPDCQSPDGVTGIGKIADQHGKPCAQCPMAQFGTARSKDGKPGRGQACSQKRTLFIILPDEILPAVLALPPTSLAAFKGYLAGLISTRKPITGVVTRITLNEAKNAGGTKYAEASFEAVGALDEATTARMTEFGRMFSTMFSAAKPAPTSVTVNRAPAGGSPAAQPKNNPPGWTTGASPKPAV